MANCIRCGRQLPGVTFGKKICQWCVQHEAAQRGELADDAHQPVMRTPWVQRGESTIGLTQIIFGINAAVFLGMVLAGSTVMEFPLRELVQWGANVGALTFSGEWWRLITNVFVHGGLIHIAFNMWCLWNLGQLCESAFKLGEFSVPRSALSGTLRSLGAFVVYNLIFGFILPGVDNTAHIGGLVTGLIVGALIALIAPHEHGPRRIAIFLTLTLVLAAGAAGIAHHYGLPLRLGRVNITRSSNLIPRGANALVCRSASLSC
jgi:membrane associated rhomboid family serine protease